jgi:hypothetical protein
MGVPVSRSLKTGSTNATKPSARSNTQPKLPSVALCRPFVGSETFGPLHPGNSGTPKDSLVAIKLLYTTAAVKMVLVEIGQILGSLRGKFAVVGGSVPWLLLEDSEMEHVGTLDVDLNLDTQALQNGEYADLIRALMGHQYHQTEDTKNFQLRRMVPARDGGDDIDVRVDFLMPASADIKKNKPKFIENFRIQKADGPDRATQFH